MNICKATRDGYYEHEAKYRCDLPEGHDGLHAFLLPGGERFTVWRDKKVFDVWSNRSLADFNEQVGVNELRAAVAALKVIRSQSKIRGRGRSEAAKVVFGR